ncbi:MAG: DUF4157 domain-containing protein [Ferruginibacter sp.]
MRTVSFSLPEKSGTAALNSSGTFWGLMVQPKRTVNQPGDEYEKEADAMADKVMRMKQPFIQAKPLTISGIQRKCAHCEEEKKNIQRKEIKNNQITAGNAPESYIDSLNGSGEALSNEVRNFYEPRFGYDFSNVRIHTGTTAAKSAQSINALAYTNGNNIVFNDGQYSPGTDSGKRLLGHELTHVVQQQSGRIQRAVHSGQDYAGNYEFDDRACTLKYNQDWYFSFHSGMTAAQQAAYLASAESQVENTWSHKHHLIPLSAGCPCSSPGVDVDVNLNTFNEPRNDRSGYDVEVTKEWSGVTSQPSNSVTVSQTQDVPEFKGDGLYQPVIAHEFGHTLGITDEYHAWAAFWNAIGHNDRSSLMHHGDQVRPRHYQHFADLISNEIEGCSYQPEGFSLRSLANPLVSFGVTGAVTNDAEFVLDLNIDRHLGNRDILGLFTPRLGFSALLNTANGNVMAGPTVSLSLNRLAHPLYLNIGTGLLYDPEDPGRPASVNLPASLTAGLRGDGFSAGINYTVLKDLSTDILSSSGYTHMVGINFQFDLDRK